MSTDKLAILNLLASNHVAKSIFDGTTSSKTQLGPHCSVLKYVESFEGTHCYRVVRITTNDGAVFFIKFNGWTSSYYGDTYSDWEEVVLKTETRSVWVSSVTGNTDYPQLGSDYDEDTYVKSYEEEDSYEDSYEEEDSYNEE